MPLGTGWLVDVRDYFMMAPEAMVVAVILIHYLMRKLGKQTKNTEDQKYYNDFFPRNRKDERSIFLQRYPSNLIESVMRTHFQFYVL